MKLRALIVDDEPLGRERVRSLLKNDADVCVVGEAHDGPQAVAAILKHKPDLVFLDVQMPELDGFGVLEAIGAEDMPEVIFVTAYDRYALRAFEVTALDYLLKPFDRKRFTRALARAKSRMGRARESLGPRLAKLLDSLERKHLERLVIRSGGRVIFLRAEEVDWIEAAGNYARLHVGREEHLLRETMNNLETKLDPRRFRRIHRSTIVNVDRIRELRPDFHGDFEVLLRDGERLTLTRNYRENLSHLLGQPL